MHNDTPTSSVTVDRTKPVSGFSLIELLVVIAIVGILAGLAYPSYTSYILKTKRSDGVMSLLQAVQAMERCKSTSFSYANCTLNAQLATSAEGNYALTLTPAPTASTFSITATAQGSQTGDSLCTTLTITHLGEQTSTPSAAGTDANGCWN